MNPLISAAASLILLSSLSFGAITYIDADPTTNTFETATGSVDTDWYVSGKADTDPLWGLRAFANSTTIFEGRSEAAGDDVPLTTQLSGLGDGTYNVWAFFWDASGSNGWELSTGLSGNPIATYSFDGAGNTTAPVDAGTLDLTGVGTTAEDDRIMYGVNLGQATVSGGSSINVLIQQLGNGSGSRTWYDGVGYEVVPEPSAALLIGLGGLALLRRRRS